MKFFHRIFCVSFSNSLLHCVRNPTCNQFYFTSNLTHPSHLPGALNIPSQNLSDFRLKCNSVGEYPVVSCGISLMSVEYKNVVYPPLCLSCQMVLKQRPISLLTLSTVFPCDLLISDETCVTLFWFNLFIHWTGVGTGEFCLMVCLIVFYWYFRNFLCSGPIRILVNCFS